MAVERSAAGDNLVDTPQDGLDAIGFEQVAMGPRGEGFEHDRFVIIHGQDEDFGLGKGLAEFWYAGDTMDTRQTEIEKNDIDTFAAGTREAGLDG
jgi:hypothetical protein